MESLYDFLWLQVVNDKCKWVFKSKVASAKGCLFTGNLVRAVEWDENLTHLVAEPYSGFWLAYVPSVIYLDFTPWLIHFVMINYKSTLIKTAYAMTTITWWIVLVKPLELALVWANFLVWVVRLRNLACTYTLWLGWWKNHPRIRIHKTGNFRFKTSSFLQSVR